MIDGCILARRYPHRGSSFIVSESRLIQHRLPLVWPLPSLQYVFYACVRNISSSCWEIEVPNSEFMMNPNTQQAPPDLASILRTLAGLAPQPQPQQNQEIYDQARPAIPHSEQAQQSWAHPPPEQLAPPRSTTPTEPVPRGVDPATIVEWSAGLRCVMKTVARHENMLNDIRRVCPSLSSHNSQAHSFVQMMKVQREHEEQWWAGRETLIEKQKARKEGQKKLDDVL